MRFNWGTGIALAYTLFAGSTVAFVVFAMNHPVQLVSDDYYERALRHDERREARENASALDSGIARVREDGRAVLIALPPAHAGDARGTARLYRPSDAAADRSVPLTLDAGGHQTIPLDGLASGRWIVQLDWTSGARPFYSEMEVMLR
jgi:hypothetical protein